MSTTEIKFGVSRQDEKIILQLAARARGLEARHGGEARDTIDWVMDFTAVHANGTPLRLDDLLDADDFNFMHDAFGICRHLDRDTGHLTNFFRPRFSVPCTSDEGILGQTA